MNIINKLLLLLSLSMTPAVTVLAQEVNNESMTPAVTVSAQAANDTFDTFQTVDQYLEDFDYVNKNSCRESLSEYTYLGGAFRFYAFPIYYEIEFSMSGFLKYYENDYYSFYTYPYSVSEREVLINVTNYIGTETQFRYLALDYIGMSQVIEHDNIEKSNSISIYNSFYNFFTGFFPENVVAEYHGIFTFIVVGFLLFLVFGFVFFLFRVIRRLVGFK